MASSSSRREVTPHAMQRGSGGQMSAPSPSSTRHSQPLPKGGSDVGCKTMRSVPSSRGLTRNALHKKNGSDRPEHPLSSHSRIAAEERASAAGGDATFGPGTASARGGGAGGAHRRGVTENSSSNSDLAADRRISHPRDPLRRSRDTNVSDTPTMAERGGHGRDGPVIPRDPAAANAGGGGSKAAGGGGGGGGGLERERTSGVRVGEEEIPMEVSGRYERMRVLGRGSFGAVTLVKDNRDSKLYAMKTLNCADKLEERVTAMAEVRLLKWLKHPSILSLFDTFLSTDGRLVCLTTTYCESGDLAKIVKHSSRTNSLLGEKTVLGWFAQLCLGVHHLHEEKKVLHRDIKPNNVFLMDSKKIVQLGDFGLAKVLNDGDKQVKAEVGTPYYTSPEMCNNQPYGFPSDVWSLGIVLYELLSLDVPFRSRDVVALVSQVIKAPPPPLPEVYSSETTALARWMLQKDPLRRPTLTQALACQPLRRHMTSFVKHYRPMNMAERQRRHDIKDLEAQVASIIERGGEDPQIPHDVGDGCGTLPTGAQDEELEAAGGEAERLSLPGGVPTAGEGAGGGGGGGGAAGVAGLSRARATDVGFSSPRTAGVGLDGAAMALRTDEDEARGPCVRCGARVPCACGGGVGDGGPGVGGNITPGRRFGSPQHCKGARHVMSWATGGSVTEGNDREDDGRSSASSSNDRGRRRRGSSSGGGSGGSVDGAEWDGRVSGRSSPAGSTRSHSSGDGHGSGGNERGCRAEGGSGSGARRKRCRAVEGRGSNDPGTVDGVFQGGSDHRSNCTDANASPAPETQPVCPRSPPSQRSARVNRASGGSGSSGGGTGDARIGDGKSESERTPGAAARDTSTSRREGGTGREDGILPPRQQQAGGISPPPSSRPAATSAAAAAAATTTTGAEAAAGAATTTTPRALSTNSALPAALAGAPHEEADGARIETGPAGELAGGQPSHQGVIPQTSAEQEGARARSVALAEVAPRASSGGGGRTSAVVAAAELAGVVNTAKGGVALDRLGISPRTPRSPRLTGSGSDTSKTAKRLSEALTYAASGREETIGSAPAPIDTPTRGSSVVAGAGLAPAAAAAATAPR